MNDKSLKAKACTEYVGEPNYVNFKYKGFDCEIKRHEYLLRKKARTKNLKMER